MAKITDDEIARIESGVRNAARKGHRHQILDDIAALLSHIRALEEEAKRRQIETAPDPVTVDSDGYSLLNRVANLLHNLRTMGCDHFTDHRAKLKTEIEDYLQRKSPSPPTASEDQWKPIESAPKDGTAILLFTTCHGVVEAWFAQGEWSDDTPIHPREYSGAAWVCADDSFQIEVEEGVHEDGSDNHGTATHWMPLPAPPPRARS